MTGVTLQTLTVERRFAASPERLFDAWLDPKVVSRWLFTGPTSEAHTAELDARVGGNWTIMDKRDGTEFTATGEYRVIDRPRRLVFTFGMPQFDPGFAEVTVVITPDGDGARMTLTQNQMDPAAIEPTRQGWTLMFEGLREILASAG